MENLFSFTGIVYTPISFVFSFVTYRFYREWEKNKTSESRDIFSIFASLTFVCFSGAFAGTVFTHSKTGIIRMLIASSILLTFANGFLGHLFVHLKFPKISAWWGFGTVFIYGSIITILTIFSEILPKLETSGGLDWGLPNHIDYLRSIVYFMGTVPISIVYLQKYRETDERYLKSEYLFLVMVFLFALGVVIVDFIIEPLIGAEALLSEVALLIFAIIGMVLYFILHEKVLSKAERELRKNYNRLQKAFDGTINVLISTLGLRDPYTVEHQKNVAEIAVAIAKKIKLTENEIADIRMAARIHDIGKINVPTKILTKIEKISDLEYSLIKTHSQVGFDILSEAVDFDWSVARMVLQHHEKMDGSGYPNGITGDELDIGSRIICVADVVEAITFDRPYRPALGINFALREIKSNKGKLYDEKIVDICVELFENESFGKQHKWNIHK
ncbi:MAG: HD-GYP domain-containing protein [Candidatus Cloacimonetes bacterium]|nr:HD-GYP domain-containing protein [Candidatus Cloacimonadota bacterium]